MTTTYTEAPANPDGSYTLPPGDYLIGDPCRLIPESMAEDWIDRDDDAYALTLTTEDGTNGALAVFHTAHGDGAYTDQGGRAYPVDSGSLCVIDARLAAADRADRALSHGLVHPLTLTGAGLAHYETTGGVVTFGPLRIPTDHLTEA